MPLESPYLLLFIALAGSVQGTVGFGFGLVAMSTLPLWLGIKESVPVVALLCLVVNIALIWRLRHHLTLPRLGPMLLGGLIGVPIGVTLFVNMNADLLMMALGVALIGVAAQQARSGATVASHGAISPAWGGVAGLASGVLGGAFNTGGPPVVMYVGMQRWSKEHTVSTLQVFLLFTSLLQVGLFTLRGTIGTPQLFLAAKLMVPTLVGVLVGQLFFRHIDQDRFRRLLLGAISLLGLSLLYKGVIATLG